MLGLIGRDGELDAIGDAIAKGARVVTLVGGPGTGKSALAAAYARNDAPAKTRGRRLALVACDLGAARTTESLGAALAQALGGTLGAAEGEAAIVTALGRQLAQRGPALVVLDDADGVVEPLARALPQLLRDAPEARFLVTSRARLDVPGELPVDVPPLAVPPEDARDAAEIEATDAVRLFVTRAAERKPGYRIPHGESATIAQIVRRLDGIPLAIELCAARVPVLGERAIAELLAERFDVLELGRGGPPGRTLTRAIAWSWDLLDDDGRRALARCSVFAGSFDLAAATAVGIGRVDVKQPRVGAAAELDKLEARSLVRVFEPEALPGERRYVLFASVRAFAADRLAERGDEREARLALGRWLADLPEPPAAERVARLALERGDLARAWEVAMAERDLRTAVRVALRAEPLALAHGPLAPHVAMLDATLGVPELPPELAAPLHLSRGLATLFRGKRDVAVLDFEAARRLGREPDVRVLATSKLALVLGLKGRFDEARRLFDEATRTTGASGRARGIVLKDLANVLSEEGANDEAMVTLARARDALHEAGEVREEGFVTMLIGGRLVDEGRLEDARRDLEVALELLRRAGDRRSEAWTTALVALAEGELGEHAAARARLEAAARAFQAIGDVHTEGLVLGFTGQIALEQGLLGDAERAYREARRLLEGAGDLGALALVLAASAVADARLGHLAAARDGVARALELAAADARAPRAEAVRVLATVLADEAARAAVSAPRPGDAEELRFARRIVGGGGGGGGSASGPAGTSRPGGVVAAKDGSWLRLPNGETVRLGRSKTLRAVVERLVTERREAPGRPVAPAVLVRAGWPGERILPAAAKNRLHVTITRLRRLGLGDLIVHTGDGYMLDPLVDLRPDEDL